MKPRPPFAPSAPSTSSGASSSGASSSSTPASTQPQRVAVDDLDDAVEHLRLARVSHTPLLASRLVIRAPAVSAVSAVVVDAANSLADVDARLGFAAIAHRLWGMGYTVPLFRPWPTMPLWRLAMTMPYVVDAMMQRATLMTIDGDVADTPNAPRHAAGPSMLHSVCGPQPLALLRRAHLRIAPREGTCTGVIDVDSAAAAATVVVSAVAAGRVVATDAIAAVPGRSPAYSVALFGSAAAVVAAGARVVDDADADAFSSWACVGARVRRSRSLAPGDTDAMARALGAGHRVVAMPGMQRAAALLPASPVRSPSLVGVDVACRAIGAALIAGSHHAAPEAL